MTSRAWRLALVAAVVASGAASLGRPGYTPDEEFTLFAVRGISADGLPLLPSGLLYDRGLAYSCLCWLANALTGLELPAYRAIALVSSAAALWVLASVVGRSVSSGDSDGGTDVPPYGTPYAAAVAAATVPFWAVATTGRFYGPFLFAYLLCVAAYARVRDRETVDVRALVALAAAAALCRWTHELAFTIVAVPAIDLVLTRSSRAWARGAALVTGLAVAQAVLVALNYAAPANGDTMIRRFFLWQVLNLFEVPHGAPLGVIASLLVVSWVMVPARAVLGLVIALCGFAMAAAFVLVRPDPATAFAAGFAYPLDMFWSLLAGTPVLTLLAFALLVARLLGAGGEWKVSERAAHLAWMGWTLWFGVIDSGITTNYLLLPAMGLAVAVAVDLSAVVRHQGAARRQVFATAAMVIAAVAVADGWRGGMARFVDARPTIRVEGIDRVREELQPDDRVACTDELGCLLLVGRDDRWLALDAYVRERFVVRRGGIDTGVYAGAPAAFTLAELFAPGPDGVSPRRVVVVDVFKEYPVGNSRAWLPRALAIENYEARPLLETAQARVVVLGAPVGNASLQPNWWGNRPSP